MQTPAFLADKLPINQAKTLYTIWIGTDYGAPFVIILLDFVGY